ncbi:MAG: thioredoxin domain-containing protein [Magnetococcales bacterium]|nr:thioredoxin domain-containing protein [Magnetococcales bacterium]
MDSNNKTGFLPLISRLLLVGLIFMGDTAFSANQTVANRLISETSPYLLQHAHNPVDWYPWGEEALAKAKAEDKLIFVSIGYAACHWCQVMERESFESEATAKILNRHFISIKVDREERPDLDRHFMAIITAMTGSGGWPMNIFLTPDLQPVYGGTYFPPEPRYDRASFDEVLSSLQEQWNDDKQEMLQSLEKLKGFLAKKLAPPKFGPASTKTEDTDPRDRSVEFWSDRFDWVHGGIGNGTKFPQPLVLSLLLRQAASKNSVDIAEPALLTLDKMAAGGIRDQLGGSFHRYSVDRYWHVPHFEIMLYDNALLARTYLEAYRLTKESRYKFVVQQIIDDMLKRFRVNNGCFISSINADSEGHEGAYYTWSEEEVEKILGREAPNFISDFVDTIEGTVDERSVLRVIYDEREIDKTFNNHAGNLTKLLAAREKRVPPTKDDKILTSWNSLMVSSLASAGAVLQEPRYLKAAEECMADLLEKSFVDGKPRHSRRGDKVGDVVFLDDYATVIQALIDLYEANFNISYLGKARSLAEQMLSRFKSKPGEPLPLTPTDQPSDLPEQIILEDGVTPSGNSSALVALHRLALFSSDRVFEKDAKERLDALSGYLEENPYSSPELLWAFDFRQELAKEVVIVGPHGDKATKELFATVRKKFMPGVILAGVDPANPASSHKWPLLSRQSITGKPTAYVCKDLVCKLPVFTPEALAKILGEMDKK